MSRNDFLIFRFCFFVNISGAVNFRSLVFFFIVKASAFKYFLLQNQRKEIEELEVREVFKIFVSCEPNFSVTLIVAF